jgi:four helix bundle protein
MPTLSNVTPQIERTKVTSYRDLVVWARAMDLVVACYQLTKQIPQSEIYGLTSQIRRAAVSIPANIAEGHGRRNLGEYIQHLSIANGSLKELETHLLIAGRLQYVKDAEIIPALEGCGEIGRMLASLMQKLRQKRL